MSDPLDDGPPAADLESTYTWTDEAGPSFLEQDEALRALRAALSHGERPDLLVDIVVVSAETLAGLHAQFLDDPTETDVITFDLSDDEDKSDPVMGGPDGEIYLSADRARAVSEDRGMPPKRELVLYLVHGALHLCGLDDHDESDRAAMRAAECTVMAGLGYAADTAPHDLP